MKTYTIVILLILGLSLNSFSQVNVGDKSPQFSAKDDTNQLWESSAFIGKKVLVVYFYPAAMTGGCTKQACGFRDDKAKFDELDAIVIGISGDNDLVNHKTILTHPDIDRMHTCTRNIEGCGCIVHGTS